MLDLARIFLVTGALGFGDIGRRAGTDANHDRV